MGTEPQYLFKASGFSFQRIGDGMGGPGTLLLGNFSFDWNGISGVPVSIVLDAAGLFGALGSVTVAPTLTVVGGTNYVAGRGTNYSLGPSSATYVGGATPASEHAWDLTSKSGTTHTEHVGPAPIMTTTWNTTLLCVPGGGSTGLCMGMNPSGTLPLIADTVGGSPMLAGPIESYNINLDLLALHLDTVVVPVPSAVWLFGTGLIGLVGIAKRRRKT